MKATFYSGRFQPITISHNQIIEKISIMENPFVFIIDGEKSSTNKDKNPLGINLRLSTLKHLFPKVTIYEAKDIINCFDILDVMGFDELVMYCGEDRYENYKKLISTYSINCDIICQERKDDISATKVRNLIRNDDISLSRKLMPSKLPDALFKRIVEEVNGHTNNDRTN